MFRFRFHHLIVCGAILSGSLVTGSARALIDDVELTALVESVRAEHNQPALAAAVVRGDEIVAKAAVGRRSTAHDAEVTVSDRFHIGSCTKAITSTMIARLIERGDLTWETTIVDVFPELTDEIHEQYRTATLEQLLTHQAGVPSYTHPTGREVTIMHAKHGSSAQNRLQFLKTILADAPQFEPGTDYLYSNAGYGIAAAIAEKKTGQSWEDLLREHVFEPLQMKTAAFGWPYDAGEDQPLGHIVQDGGRIPLGPAAPYRLPDSLAPAGNLSMSIEDFARFARCHLLGSNGKSSLLREETFRKLHSPVRRNYGMGWIEVNLAGAPATAHNGSAGTFFAWMLIWPDLDLAIVTASNSGDGDAPCRALAQRLFDQFAKKDTDSGNQNDGEAADDFQSTSAP